VVSLIVLTMSLLLRKMMDVETVYEAYMTVPLEGCMMGSSEYLLPAGCLLMVDS
jgi:hypothetical protein